MATSRSVDRLAYTYYTGQDGSEAHGPNCHTCMNDLFREGKLYGIQMVFINTPSGLVPVTTRFLVFAHGVTSPFSMTSFAEDFLVTRCAQCAEKAIRMQMSKEDDNHGIIVNTLDIIKTECVPEAIPVMCATLATEQLVHTLTHTDSSTEVSSGQLGLQMELQSNTASQSRSYERRRSSSRSRSPYRKSRSRSRERTRSSRRVRRSGYRPYESRSPSLDRDRSHDTSPPRRFFCRSRFSKEGSRSQDRKGSESGECRPEPGSKKHRDRSRGRERSRSRDNKKNRERYGKKRKRSRSRSRNRKKDRTSRSRDPRSDEKSMEDSNDNEFDLPFLYGRSIGEVNDPILEADNAPGNWRLRMVKKDVEKSLMNRYLRKLARLYFVNQEVLSCGHCGLMFSSFHSISLVYHLLSKRHWNQVKEAGLVFSHSKDLKKLLESSIKTYRSVQVKSARIPFVFASRIMGNELCLARLANYFNCLMRMGLITEDFSDYLFHVFPNLKDIDSCSLCELPISPGRSADGYLKHFLSSTHIAKANENNWNLGSDFGRFVSHVHTFLKRNGRREEASVFLSKLQLSGK